jgi:hypothetical protein
MAAAAAAELHILRAGEGQVVAGTVIGADQFVHKFLPPKQQEGHADLQRLADLPHPLTCQDK